MQRRSSARTRSKNNIDHFRSVLGWIVVHAERALAKGSIDHFDDGVGNALNICIWGHGGGETFEYIIRETLEPMTAPRAASYLASLVRNPLREPPAATDGPAVLQSDVGPTPMSGKIEITALELDYMRALAAYVGPSPRRVKRLVNAYRLIKARMSDAQLIAFLTGWPSQGDGPYQIVIQPEGNLETFL